MECLTCYVGGEILSSMALNEQNDWTQSSFCKGPLKLFPPEPLDGLELSLLEMLLGAKKRLNN